ncbi:MAG: alpha/beta hydrolase-fold protein [Micropepsaceae bacterium]
MLRTVLLGAAFAAGAVAFAEPQPYTLERTEVHEVPAPELGRSYDVYVALPESYAANPERRYPVVFTTDATYAFPVTRAIAGRVGDKGEGLDDFIIVGLSYARGEDPADSRRRDYTPSPNGPKSAGNAVHGGVEAYRQYVESRVIPFVAETYRIDDARMIFAGHSYGGLFGLHVMFTKPDMFDAYILGSPSLWFDKKVMFKREAAYAEAHDDLKAKVFFAIGSYETMKPESDDPRYHDEVDMVGDLEAFVSELKGRAYPGLELTSEVIDGEDHLTVGAIIITHGLLWALRPAS